MHRHCTDEGDEYRKEEEIKIDLRGAITYANSCETPNPMGNVRELAKQIRVCFIWQSEKRFRFPFKYASGG